MKTRIPSGRDALFKTKWVLRMKTFFASFFLLVLVALFATGIHQVLNSPNTLEPVNPPVALLTPTQPESFLEPVYSLTLDEKTCLALNLYHEGRDQGNVGMLLIGHVTLNRVESERYPDTICEVVYQPRQFSWTHSKNFIPHEEDSWNEALKLTDKLLSRTFDRSGGSLYYYNPKLASPDWARSSKLKVVVIHKDHTFLRRL